MTVSAAVGPPARAYSPPVLSPDEFAWISAFAEKWTGIEFRDGKQTLITGRLERRLRHHGLDSYTEYFRLLGRPEAPQETTIAIDLLTTNETYFFREPNHFERLPYLLPAPRADRPVRVWSAASSTGEEACTIALTLADHLGLDQAWEVVGTDISTRVLDTARRGLYPVEAAERIPERLRKTFCLKGRDEYDGLFTLRPELRKRMSFHRANLTRDLPDLGLFDVVFLRNVLIYFGQETKYDLLLRLAQQVRAGGFIVIGHAETLSGLDLPFVMAEPTVYRVEG